MARRSFVIGLLLAALAVGLLGSSWALSPTLRERVLLLGLVSGISGIQGHAARALEDHPTRTTALALVTFVNWAHQPPLDLRGASSTLARPERSAAEDRILTQALLERAGCLPEALAGTALTEIPRADRRRLHECLEEKARVWDEARRPRLELAGRGFRSLCALSGHTFETRCLHHGGSVSWGSMTDAEWSRALGSLNGWALATFGGDLLAAAAGGPQG